MALGPTIYLQDTNPLAQILGSLGRGIGGGLEQMQKQQYLNQNIAGIDWNNPSSVLKAMASTGIDPKVIGGLYELQQKKVSEANKRPTPSLTLNEQLGRLQDRLKIRNDTLLRPFYKQDALGNMVLDFGEEDERRVAVLKKLDEIASEYEGQVARLYGQYGMPVPEDVIAHSRETMQMVNQSGGNEQQGMATATEKQTGTVKPKQPDNDSVLLESKFPAAKHAGKTFKDNITGKTYKSIGGQWVLQ